MLLHYKRASLNTLEAANIVSPIVGVRAVLLRDESGVEGMVSGVITHPSPPVMQVVCSG
jgi:hypothetical protein